MEHIEIETEWKKVLNQLSPTFGEDLDLQAIVFLIGIQELGKGFSKFKKEEKLDIMHIAVCTLLEPYGYYEYEGKDKEGWPHWKTISKLPSLKGTQQNHMMKEAIIEYFKYSEVIPGPK